MSDAYLYAAARTPVGLIDALIRQGAGDLTVVSSNAGNGDVGLAALLEAGRVRKMTCSFPRQSDSYVFDELCRAGRVDLEVVPQGTLAERMRAAGAGIGVFYCPVGVGTPLAEGKETREIDGLTYVLEHPIKGDVALISPHRADALGNLRRLPGADGVSGPWRRTASRSRSCRNGSTSICSRDLVVYGA